MTWLVDMAADLWTLASKACLNLLNENMTFMPDEADAAFGKWQPSRDNRRNP